MTRFGVRRAAVERFDTCSDVGPRKSIFEYSFHVNAMTEIIRF
jgi:hypothetical protein